MQGQIAQNVAVTLYANAYLQGRLRESLAFTNSTFQFVHEVQFLRQDLRSQKNESFAQKLLHFGKKAEQKTYVSVASNMQEWFQYLQNQQTKRLALIAIDQKIQGIKDSQTVGMVGGGPRWLLVAYKKDSSDCWESYWKTLDTNAEDKRIWLVTYVLTGEGLHPPNVDLTDDIEDCNKQLILALQKAHSFAIEVPALKLFADCFERALQTLTSDNPLLPVFHQDLAPPEFLSLPASRLLTAVQQAWVFGGMGSWNDVSINGASEARYEQVSDELFAQLKRSLMAAANSSTV